MANKRPDISFFISIHIPKTAGTTVATILDRAMYRRVLFDYPDYESYYQSDKLLTKHASFVSEWFYGIHGHFGASRYVDVFTSAKYLATVRHPVDRIISQYLHERNDAGPDSAWHELIVSGRLSVVEFAAQDGVGNAMAKHLDGIDIGSYDLLLVSERLPDSLHMLNYVIGNLHLPVHFGDPPVIPILNTRQSRLSLIDFDDETKAQIYMKAAQDVEIYKIACEHLDAKIKKYVG